MNFGRYPNALRKIHILLCFLPYLSFVRMVNSLSFFFFYFLCCSLPIACVYTLKMNGRGGGGQKHGIEPSDQKNCAQCLICIKNFMVLIFCHGHFNETKLYSLTVYSNEYAVLINMYKYMWSRAIWSGRVVKHRRSS